MMFQRINRSSPERVFLVVYNSHSTSSMTNGQAVSWDYTTDADGVSVCKPAASIAAKLGHLGSAFAGIAAETIAAGAYGLIQVYGYHSAVRVRSATGGSPGIAAGQALSLVNAVWCLESFVSVPTATSTLTQMVFDIGAFALAAQASWTTKAVACFIKAL